MALANTECDIPLFDLKELEEEKEHAGLQGLLSPQVRVTGAVNDL